jgi:hypothetical protein
MLTTDRLTSRMFVEYYTTIHAGGKRPLTVSPSYYNSADVAVGQILSARKALGPAEDLLVLYAVPESFDPVNTPVGVLEASDLVFMANPKRTGADAPVLKACPEALATEVVARFSANLRNMAGSM